MIRALPLVAVLLGAGGCGAPAVPVLTALTGAVAGVARLDTVALDGLEYLEGREAHPIGACTAPPASSRSQ